MSLVCFVMISFLPGGNSSMIEMSRSPYCVASPVRGIGVYDMIRTWGFAFRALNQSLDRCSTPKRCCSSITTRPRSWNITGSSINACTSQRWSWVDPALPAVKESLRAGALVLPVSISISSGNFPKLFEAFEMLLRQNFRWCHQAGLIAITHGNQHGQQCNNRLATAHITLEPVHLFAWTQISCNFFDYAFLLPVSATKIMSYKIGKTGYVVVQKKTIVFPLASALVKQHAIEWNSSSNQKPVLGPLVISSAEADNGHFKTLRARHQMVCRGCNPEDFLWSL